MVAGDDESKATVTSATPQKATSGSTEFEPPMACIRRMLKTSLPANTNVGKDACGAFSRACGIFIVYLTACANDFARESKRQTITANDVLAAVKELDFDEFTPKLTAFIEQHRQSEKKKKARKKSGDLGKASKTSEDKDDDEDDDDDDESQAVSESSPMRKRQKTDSSNNVDAEDQDEHDGSEIGGDGDDVESFADTSQDDNDASVSNDETSQD
mmetsp:Transcript_15435/g.29110  ORF Transcript_15435/g.29110 Transcript_15435/m.29110 type:complete len:214 (-) Transcript_15435:2395-3036(-)